MNESKCRMDNRFKTQTNDTFSHENNFCNKCEKYVQSCMEKWWLAENTLLSHKTLVQWSDLYDKWTIVQLIFQLNCVKMWWLVQDEICLEVCKYLHTSLNSFDEKPVYYVSNEVFIRFILTAVNPESRFARKKAKSTKKFVEYFSKCLFFSL